ncbi:MAG UNVERIFIED_CONTAM: hypothetical protein LVR18_34020 [Planctomycetaceae bacterium]|jgi:hypothetical protein
MVTDKQPPNPYAAPVFPEPTADTFEFHQSYDLVDSKLLSRNGLWLPQYCLVTGSSDDVMPIQLSIIAASHATKRCRSAGVGCFLLQPSPVAWLSRSSIQVPCQVHHSSWG